MTKETETQTILTVNLYKENTIIESYEYTNLEDATKHMSEIENAPYLYPGVTTELIYD